MMCGGFYMLLKSIWITSSFGMSYPLYGFSALGSSFSLTGGMILVPFIFGVGLVFYNGQSIAGWLLFIGSFAALVMGVITSISFSFRAMSAFDLIVILILAFGGVGFLLRSLKRINTIKTAP